MMRSSFLGLVAATTLMLSFSVAHAGECKVKEPTQAAIADAIKVGVVLELQMEELSKEYLKKPENSSRSHLSLAPVRT